MNQWIGVLAALILIAGFIFLLRRNADSGEPREQELYRLCRGDKEMMERLITHEQNRHQGRTREAAIRAAIESIKRDNR